MAAEGTPPASTAPKKCVAGIIHIEFSLYKGIFFLARSFLASNVLAPPRGGGVIDHPITVSGYVHS